MQVACSNLIGLSSFSTMQHFADNIPLDVFKSFPSCGDRAKFDVSNNS